MEKSKILVVDDEPANIELIKGYLEGEYSIIPAGNGNEAIEIIGSGIPDIALLDIMMPGMSGYEVCEKIKGHVTTRFLPVIMITALSGSQDKIKAIEAGADDFLTKPINGLELKTRVRSLLKTKYYHDELVKSKEKIEVQNEFKTIIADLLPLLMENLPLDKKTEIIWRMSKHVEKIIWTKYIDASPEDIKQVANISCGIMEMLGADFKIEKADKRSYTIKNHVCPWGEKDNLNPALCMLTKAIFARTGIRVFDNFNLEIKKTIAGGDSYCLIEAFAGKIK